MKIAIASDHGGFEYKEILKQFLPTLGHEIIDFGTYSKDSMDYPDVVRPASQAVAKGDYARGIVICSTGIGVSITANKTKGIRCALVSDLLTARLTREHNDTNMLALGQFIIGEALMKEIVSIWLTTEFQGGRHTRRIAKIEGEDIC